MIIYKTQQYKKRIRICLTGILGSILFILPAIATHATPMESVPSEATDSFDGIPFFLNGATVSLPCDDTYSCVIVFDAHGNILKRTELPFASNTALEHPEQRPLLIEAIGVEFGVPRHVVTYDREGKIIEETIYAAVR